MHVLESLWIRDRLARLGDDELFPLLDVGSSTLAYRTRVQPWIDANVFAPLRARGGRLIHADIKQAPGIDVVGDLLDLAFQARLRALGVRSVLVCNVLHHVSDRHALTKAVVDILPARGLIVASGPYRYPRHYDPIETMYRPTPEEVARDFPGTVLLDGAILDSGNWRGWNAGERGGRGLGRFLVRACLPFYKPGEWWRMLPHVPYLLRHMKAYAALLRKAS
jgi:hypothetical protein